MYTVPYVPFEELPPMTPVWKRELTVELSVTVLSQTSLILLVSHV